MIAKNKNYDVVVVGSGAAGQAAALTARENGASVLMLEKGRHTGGSANYSEGLFAVNSYLQQEKGINVSGTDVLKEEVEYSKYKADSRIWRDYVDSSAENVKWLHDEGVEYEGVQAMGAGEATWHIYKGFGDAVMHKALQPKFEKLGGELLTSTSAVDLKVNDDHTKIVTIKDEATGETEDITAKVVILAAGGYLNNEKMMAEETNYDLSRLIPVSSGKGTGDGLRLGWSVGARKYSTGMAMLFGGYLKDPNEPSFKMMGSQMNAAAGQQPLLWINENGERFVDESVIYNFSMAGNALYTQNEVYSILDTKVIKKMAKDGNFMGLGVYVKRGQKMDKLQAEIDQAVADKKPFIFKADSIEELAEKMGLPKDKLVKTIKTYNDFAKSGEDQEFGKDPEYLQAVEEGPFYGFKLNIGAFCTMGGLKVTPENEVEDNDGKVIPGLYAAGNDASGLTGDTYGPNMPGTCAGYAFYSGRNAAQHAQKYLK
ncbi:FAD-dependent oxidoreductase [Lactobacillus xujianguonis]|uniref:FAD-dependent oxidoreductase n=2 Tax=Lactobacillaceae TaxID=33958 RepID=A0A437SVP6_9LACO|nr:FAD-dependent oxidoreductase [Lactobacillus xujianguonis]RVU73932.1 FAD-dependent oxidoreductase [Lactobacillus xujianguonis]